MFWYVSALFYFYIYVCIYIYFIYTDIYSICVYMLYRHCILRLLWRIIFEDIYSFFPTWFTPLEAAKVYSPSVHEELCDLGPGQPLLQASFVACGGRFLAKLEGMKWMNDGCGESEDGFFGWSPKKQGEDEEIDRLIYKLIYRLIDVDVNVDDDDDDDDDDYPPEV